MLHRVCLRSNRWVKARFANGSGNVGVSKVKADQDFPERIDGVLRGNKQ